MGVRFESLLGLFGLQKAHMPPVGISASGVIGAPDLPSTWVTGNAYWNPNLETGTDKQGQYWDLHEGLRDPEAAACLDLRCQIAASLPWSLIAQEGTSDEALELVQYVFDHLDLPGMFEQMVKSSYYGLTAMEIFWRKDDPHFPGKVIPWDALPIDLQFVWFTEHRECTINGQVPEVGKLLLHMTGSHFRNPFGLGRGRTVPQWVRVKKAVSFYTFRDFGAYIHDKVHFTYPDDASQQEADTYLETAKRAMNAPALITRDSLKATPIRLESKFEMGTKLIDTCDAQIAKAILGNTLTTGEGKHGTQALGGVHESMTDKQTWSDGLRLETTLNNTIIKWIVEANYPGVEPPRIQIDAEVKPDMLKRLQAVLGIAELQDEDGNPFKISGSWLRDTFGIPEPDPAVKDDAFILKVQPPPAPPAPAAPALKEPAPPALAAKKTPGQRHAEVVFDRWNAQWRERVAGPHRLILAALGDGDE